MTTPDGFPQKTREFHNHHMDSTIWNDFKFRDDDVIVASWGKSGTTWSQQILEQLVFQGDGDVVVADISPWLDVRVVPKEVKLAAVEAQTHRRILKTHLPRDALVMSPKAKYIFVARDGRDVVWSLHNHHLHANEAWYHAMNDAPGLVGPPLERPTSDVREYFLHWLRNDGAPFWPFFSYTKQWWDVRDLPNIYMLHFNNLKKDLPGEIRRIAEFLEIPIDEEKFPVILEHCSFDWMKANASQFAPGNGCFWEEGASQFINKGSNGRWRDILTPNEIKEYEDMAETTLGKECAKWLETGHGL